jgi:hypothetical protein
VSFKAFHFRRHSVPQEVISARAKLEMFKRAIDNFVNYTVE